MRILAAMSSPEYLRFYDDTLLELARRGHDVVLAVGAVREGKPVRFDAIQAADRRISVAGVVPPRQDRWAALAGAIRGTMDFVRYWHPDLAPATLLRARVRRQGLPTILQGLDRVRSLTPGRVAACMRALEAAEQAIPTSRELDRFLDEHRPDMVLVTPLVEPASSQVDLVRAAHARGTPVAALVASWDNLTNKGDLKVQTGLVAVWNEAQKREAVEYHRVDPSAVVVTGAQAFDRWFARTPSRTREAFCKEVGLSPDRPFVLFTGSSIFIARADAEMPFVRRWIEALRAAPDPALRELGILVRPHPYNGRAWDPAACADLPNVAVWPRGGYDPVDEQNRAGLYDSLYHSAAVVGINTSAMIEAAVVGRPVLSVESPQFAGSQAGTLHYRHLLPEHGGFLRVSASFDEHVTQLGELLRHPQRTRQELESFVGSFVRPHGVSTASTPRLVDALERFGSAASRVPAPAKRPVLRAVLGLLTGLGPLLLAPSERKRAPRGRKGSSARGAEISLPVRLALVAPVLAGTLLVAGFAVLESVGVASPVAYPAPRNLAEATGMGSGPETLRLLAAGERASTLVDVSPDVISSSVTRVTALEAAIWSRRIQLIRLLDRQGVLGDAATRRHLTCLAVDLAVDDVVEYLAAGTAPACVPGETLHAIEARSR